MAPPPDPKARAASPLRAALSACRASFAYAGFFSLCINLLALVPTFYMLAVYDRVLMSRSIETLLFISAIALFLFLVSGALEWVRSRILVSASLQIDALLASKVFDGAFRQAVASGGKQASAQPLSDLLALRQFLGGPGPLAFFDAPWLPIYVILLFWFHPLMGVVGVVSGIVLILLTIWNDVGTRERLESANRQSLEANQYVQRNLRNAEVVEAHGMLSRVRGRWFGMQSGMLREQAQASAAAGLIGGLSRTFRVAIQSLVLGLGAFLAIHKEISSGMLIAGSVLLGRALAPLDVLINGWRGFLQAREAWGRLDALLHQLSEIEEPMPLPRPTGRVSFEQANVVPAGSQIPVLRGVNLMIEPGMQVAIIGPSGSGKSTFARAVLGLARTAGGAIRLDGAELSQWNREQLGPHLGYLPQDVELLDGTIAENIARFGEIDSEAVVEAARSAGVHDLIVRLPGGYETALVSGGHVLSAGQLQRIGLARALYGKPQLIVLDEPNANLDQEGEQALSTALAALKREGRTVIVVTHRSHALANVDRIIVLMNGQVAAYGLRDEVLEKLNAAQTQAAAPARPAAASAGPDAPGPKGLQ